MSTNSIEPLKEVIDKKGNTRAHLKAKNKEFSDLLNFEILSLANKTGWTVAHEMAKQGYIFPLEEENVHLLKDKDDWTVFHETLKSKKSFLKTKEFYLSSFFEKNDIVNFLTFLFKHLHILLNTKRDLDFLKIKFRGGKTIAHILAERNVIFPEDRLDILSLKTRTWKTVAHVMAETGYSFPLDRLDILSLRTRTGKTVAHVMAERNKYLGKNPEILLLKTKYGKSVAEIIYQDFTEDFIEELYNLDKEVGERIIFLKIYKDKYNFTNKNILKLTFENYYHHKASSITTQFETIAHLMVIHNKYNFPETETEILKLEDKYTNRETVAHYMVRYNRYFFSPNNKEILFLKNANDLTVLELMIKMGANIDIPENWRELFPSKNNSNINILNTLALRNFKFDFDKDFEILKTSDSYGNTVFHTLLKNKTDIPENRFDILLLSSNNNISSTVLHELYKRTHFSKWKFKFYEKDIIIKLLRCENKEDLKKFSLEEMQYLYEIFNKYRKYPIESKFYNTFLEIYNIKKAKENIFNF